MHTLVDISTSKNENTFNILECKESHDTHLYIVLFQVKSTKVCPRDNILYENQKGHTQIPEYDFNYSVI